MSLGRLLTAGRSLVGGSHSELHYRMSHPKTMPKFNAARNPFRSKANPVAAPADTSPALVAAAEPEPMAPQPQAAPTAAPSPTQPKAQSGRARLALAGVRERVTQFFGWFSRPHAVVAKPAVPRFEKQPVQGELSLDRIKVVRNDLSDADLEVVSRAPVTPVKRAPAPAPTPQSQPELVAVSDSSAPESEKPGAARTVWNRAGRLLGAGKS